MEGGEALERLPCTSLGGVLVSFSTARERDLSTRSDRNHAAVDSISHGPRFPVVPE